MNLLACCSVKFNVYIYIFFFVKVELVSTPVEEEAPVASPQESPVQQHPADTKDDEEPMEQEESNPVIQEENDSVSLVSYCHCVINDLLFTCLCM